MTKLDEAREALAGVQESEARLSRRMQWPFWRHAAVGVGGGVLMFAQTLESGLTVIVSFAVVLGAYALQKGDMRRDGMFVSGLNNGRSAWIGYLMVALLVALALYIKLGMDSPQTQRPAFWAILVGTVIGSTALSYLWQRAYRAELHGK